MTEAGWRSQLPTLARLEAGMRAIDWRRYGWRDAVCVFFLIAATWHLAGQDGGRPIHSLVPALGLAVVVLTATLSLLRYGPRTRGWLIGAWSAGPILALATGEVRAGWVEPLAALALAVPVYLATRHLWNRPYGPATLGLILGATAARAWGEGFLAYWGGSGANHWLSLSWHNQSATLMGVVALLGFGLAVATKGWQRLIGFALTAAGGSAAWLGASRGAFIMALVALAVSAGVAFRRCPWRRVLGTLTGAILLAACLTLGLGTMASTPGTGAERLVERGLDRGNLDVRFDYWQGAWGMLREAPLTGTGPGSYRWSSVPYASVNTQRSTSAHNEYVEALAGHGILGGSPIWFAAFAGAWLVLMALVRPAPVGSAKGSAGLVASAGILALLGAHAGFDFDWNYPLLLVAAAVAFAVLSSELREGEQRPESSRRPGSGRGGNGWVAGLAAGLLVAVSLWGIHQESGSDRTRWDADARLQAIASAVTDGRWDRAGELVKEIERWNPGLPSLPAVRAVVEHGRGRSNDGELAARGFHSPSIGARLMVTERLLRSGAADHAREVLAELRSHVDARRRWRLDGTVISVVRFSLGIVHEQKGCDGVKRAWDEERAWAERFGVDEEPLLAAVGSVESVARCLEA